MKKLILCALILSSVLFLNSCSNIPVKYKNQENKAVVFFDLEYSAIPIFLKPLDYYDEIEEGGIPNGFRTYRNTVVFPKVGLGQLFDVTSRKRSG